MAKCMALKEMSFKVSHNTERVIDVQTYLQHKVLNIILIVGRMLCLPFSVLMFLRTDLIYLLIYN